ncbi:hypothetical protein ACFODZ_03785 [Marinicella sediminis]|uniref:Insecticide toxin TcdB middle/N-terminal domain-containing protein n=1 Tax=Marinicella sediminis TaxID=1792834 RepID=A0ABV7J916_9GAMM|nr:hypothetical protein [Marinicella sediminis]
MFLTTAVSADDQGTTNPIENPKNLTVFPVDDIATFRSQQTVSTSALIDYVATNAELTAWSQTGQAMKSNDPCVQSLGRRLTSGRVSTPMFEQAICSTPLGLSLYYQSKPLAQGEFISYQFPKPGIGTDARNFDAQTGLFNRTAGTDDLLHMDIATAHRDLNGDLTISIIGYVPATQSQPQSLTLRDSWTDNSGRKVTGDVTLAVGDYNGDGALDLLVWSNTSTGTPSSTTGRIDMLSFSYDPIKQSLTHVDTLEIQTQGIPQSIVSAAGDFATLGHDQAVMAYYLANGSKPITLSYFQLNNKLQPVAAQIKKNLSGQPAKESYFDMSPGLFAFDPSQTSPENGAPGFHTRQLAISWVNDAGKTQASIVAVEQGGKQLSESGKTTLGSSQYTTRSQSIGPNIAAGNFIGLQDNSVTPNSQIAVAIPTVSANNNQAITTELVTAKVTQNANTGQFTIKTTDTIMDPIYAVQGLVYGPGLAAMDSLGRAFFLGNPAHIQVPSLIDPQYVVYMPPHHVDCLPNANKTDCDVINISAYNNFNVTLNDSSSSTIKQESTDTSSTDFGLGGSVSVSETVSANVLEIAELSATAQVTDAFSYQSNSTKKEMNSSYQTITTEKSATTNIDDQLGYNQRILNIWRYPVYGKDLKQPKNYPFYEITIPGPLLPYQSDGLTVSWFNPTHINNNALSYPTIGDPGFPSDLGTFTYDEQGSEVSKTTPLNDKTVRSFAGNSQTYSLTYTTGSGGSSERSYNYNLSNSLDIKTGFSAKVGIGIASSETKVDTSFNLTNKSSWGNSTVASRSMSESKGITLNQPSVSGIQTKAYNYQTLIYITGNGGIKVAHAVDFDVSTGKAWWTETYTEADPALNLPLRMVQPPQNSDWVLNTDESYHWMRGISLTTNTINKLTNSYPYLSGAVEHGDKVRVLIDVYNLSLVTPTADTQVQFAYQALDPKTFNPVGQEVVFDTSAKLKLAPRATQQIVGLWDTSQLPASTSTPYRFVITLLTDDNHDLHGDQAHVGGNNRGVWPYNNTGVFVFPKDNSNQAAMPATSLVAEQVMREQSTASFRQAADGHVSASVSLAPRAVRKAAKSNTHLTHEATVHLTSDEDHRGLVHVVVSQPSKDPDGRETVVASTMIWGLPAGERTLKLAVPHTLPNGTSTKAVLQKHNKGHQPLKVRIFSHHQQK